MMTVFFTNNILISWECSGALATLLEYAGGRCKTFIYLSMPASSTMVRIIAIYFFVVIRPIDILIFMTFRPWWWTVNFNPTPFRLYRSFYCSLHTFLPARGRKDSWHSSGDTSWFLILLTRSTSLHFSRKNSSRKPEFVEKFRMYAGLQAWIGVLSLKKMWGA